MTAGPSRARVAVLASGGGTTFQNLAELAARGELPIEIAGVISSRAGAGVLERARALGIESAVCDRRDHASVEEFSEAIAGLLDRWRPELVVMAGFLHLLRIPERYEGRVINIHPSLLPRYGGKGFYDLRVHRAVLEAGDRETGCTVHLCDDRYDSGPIVVQERIAVSPGDTPESLRDKVQALEREVYPRAIARIVEDLRRRDPR